MSRRRIEPSAKALALVLYSNGIKIKNIALAVKVSVPTVYNWVRASRVQVVMSPASAEPEAAL